MGLFKRKHCPQCGAELLPRDGQPTCPTMSCPASPLATLASVRQPPSTSVRFGYRPADHSLPPANLFPGATGHRRGLDPHPSSSEPDAARRRQQADLAAFYQPRQLPPGWGSGSGGGTTAADDKQS